MIKKKKKRTEQSIWQLREYTKHTDIGITPVPGEETEYGAEETLRERMRKNRRETRVLDSCYPQTVRSPGRMSTEKTTPYMQATGQHMTWLHSKQGTPTYKRTEFFKIVTRKPTQNSTSNKNALQKWRGNKDIFRETYSERNHWTGLHYKKCDRKFFNPRRNETRLNTLELQNEYMFKYLSIWNKMYFSVYLVYIHTCT